MCAFMHRENAERANTKIRNNSVVVAKTLDHTPAGEKITCPKIIAKGDLLHRVSAIPLESSLEKNCRTVSRSSDWPASQSDLWTNRRRKVQPGELYNKADKAVEMRMLCRTSNSEVVRILLKQTWNLLARGHGTCTRTYTKPKETCVQACEQITRPPNKTTQEQVVASRSNCEHEDREFMMDSGASLHMMSENEVTHLVVKKIPSEDANEPTVITTASGKAESTEEAAVRADDLDVFVTMMLLERFTSSAVSWFTMRKKRTTPVNGKRKSLHR